jgi:hypothetical protein
VRFKMPRLHARVTETRGFDSKLSGVKGYIRRSSKSVMYEKVEGNENFSVTRSRFPC